MLGFFRKNETWRVHFRPILAKSSLVQNTAKNPLRAKFIVLKL
jgi:hypothetical protein